MRAEAQLSIHTCSCCLTLWHCVNLVVNLVSCRGVKSTGRGKPVQRTHVDYSLNSGPGRLEELLPEEAENLQKTPYAVIQVTFVPYTLH